MRSTYIFVLLFFFLSISPVYAEDGNSSTQIHVETSGGNTETNISVESNGVKKEIHTNTPGVVNLQIENGKEITPTQGITPTLTPAISIKMPKPTISPMKHRIPKHEKPFLDNFFDRLKNLFSTLF